jgi:Uma2 family endonuclease
MKVSNCSRHSDDVGGVEHATLSFMLDFAELLPEKPRLLTRREFELLGQTDVFDADERIELLRGVLVSLPPPSPRHDAVIERLTYILIVALGTRARIRPNLTFAATDDSETLPDLAVIPPGGNVDEHPQTALLLIEVSVTSLRKDRLIKRPIYAEADVREYWIVDVDGRGIEAFTDSVNGEFTRSQRYVPGDVIRPGAFPDMAIAVNDVLVPPRASST